MRALRSRVALTAAVVCAAGGTAWGQGVWRGTIELGGRPTALIGWMDVEDERLTATLHLPDFGLMNLRCFERDVDADGVRLVRTIGRQTLELDGTLTDARYAGRWTWGAGGGAFELVAFPDEERPYRELSVRFPLATQARDAASTALELAGTVLLPTGTGPFPGVVWAHGSGGIGRGSETYVREPYRLALAGVASIVYDKRGVGASAGDYRTASFDDLARDAVAARAALANIDGVDPARIGIGGISQAASWIAPMACSFDPDFAFVLALSATTDTPPVQHRYVVRRRLERAGFGPDVVERALALHARIDTWQRDGGDASELEAELRSAADERWFAVALLDAPPLQPLVDTVRAWMWVDPEPYFRELELPVFACWGTRDDITDPVRGPRVLEELLGERVTLRTYPNADHELRLVDLPPPAPVAPGLHGDLVAWLAEHGFGPRD